MTRLINFSAGPATLPLEVLEEVQSELVDYKGTGISMLEHSHRGSAYAAVHEEATALLKKHLGCAETHDVLFMQGGATTQFALVPLNFLRGGSADYVDTGTWSKKAFAAAKYYGKPRWAASGREGDTVVRAPTGLDLSKDARYVHITTNATVAGAQYHQLPDVGDVPLVADMSSDFLHKPIDTQKLGLIYAGAQKNVGPAGVTIVVVRKEWLKDADPDHPEIFCYPYIAENDSLQNTAPTFSIYVVGKVMRWLDAQGGPEEMGRRSAKKGALLYGTVDEHEDFYRCPIEVGSRSIMNAVFTLPSEELTKKFLDGAAKEKMVNLKGHRSVGGIRVSMYNAVSVADVETLCAFMRKFAKDNG